MASPRIAQEVSPMPLVYEPRVCTHCGKTYKPRRHDQTKCSSACTTAAANHEAARGKQLYRNLYHMVLTGGRKGKAPEGAGLGDISRLVRGWIEQDKKEGILPPPLPYTNR